MDVLISKHALPVGTCWYEKKKQQLTGFYCIAVGAFRIKTQIARQDFRINSELLSSYW